jgi:polysaccharide deacetylase family protein (PEP-CTERM system associated)
MDLTFTYDLEDNRPDTSKEQRFDRVTRDVLDALDAIAVRGTFFVVATAAETAPEIIREINARGHEVALHSYDHQMLPDQTPAVFQSETQRGKSFIEDLLGVPVMGYRAPNFSLTADSIWAVDILQALEFSYSSSVLPVAHPYYGFPGTPKQPFRWSCGLLELPAPVARFGPKLLPFLGGTYFRLFPRAWLARKARSLETTDGCWFYAHPHDFDAQEPLYKIRDVSWFVTLVLRFRRRGNLARMCEFLSREDFHMTPSLGALVDEGIFDHVPTYEPVDQTIALATNGPRR